MDLKETDLTLATLGKFESRNVTFVEADGSWPIVWERARGMYVWDVAGKRYLDLTAAFGVAAAGHANAAVVRAGQRQMKRLLHAMGDVHPHPLKAELVRRLSELTFERWTEGREWGRTILGSSGFEAVEAGLKTAVLATGRAGVISFAGGYHGLGYGALNVTHREHFHGPFRGQLRRFSKVVEWPEDGEDLAVCEAAVRKLARTKKFGAVLAESIQGRGGIRIPPDGFLKMLRRVCDEFGILLILDEVFTGFGRTGTLFACEAERVVPDVICLGKALTGGFPLSACVGRAAVMDRAWAPSQGEAIHTSTFLGHPVGCAMALAEIQEVLKVAKDVSKRGEFLLRELEKLTAPKNHSMSIRGRGLMAGLELKNAKGKPATELAIGFIKSMLHRGFILLPEGERSNVISFTPPLIISERQISAAIRALGEEFAK
jgi:4-aminobutyrate aminotransferase-like enzyme